jgi:S-adenosylmethionine synthetase
LGIQQCKPAALATTLIKKSLSALNTISKACCRFFINQVLEFHTLLGAYNERKSFLFTSESVSEGHPDKVCDQISDAIVDEYLGQDAQARTAIETLATTNRVVVAGEVRGPDISEARLKEIIVETAREIGYEQDGFHWQDLKIEILLHKQSADIARGVDAGDNKDEGAGDQGIMFGFACNETPNFMPAPLYYAHNILRSLSDARHNGDAGRILGPDAKSQVTIRYENGKPVGADTVLVSTQHLIGVSQPEIRELVRKHVEKTLPKGWMCEDKKFLTNPTGQFVIGGPDGDSGLTGRKIIVDTYGGAAPHGGGAFSGKDPTKVDRSGAYAARYLAKNVVAAELADKCTIQISYAIGVAKPLSFYVNTHNTGRVSAEELEKLLPELMDLTPRGIRTHLSLNRPIYKKTASYGHFGRDPEPNGAFSWEKLDLVNELRSAFNLGAAKAKVGAA